MTLAIHLALLGRVICWGTPHAPTGAVLWHLQRTLCWGRSTPASHWCPPGRGSLTCHGCRPQSSLCIQAPHLLPWALLWDRSRCGRGFPGKGEAQVGRRRGGSREWAGRGRAGVLADSSVDLWERLTWWRRAAQQRAALFSRCRKHSKQPPPRARASREDGSDTGESPRKENRMD